MKASASLPILLLAFVGASHALYDASDAVVALTSSNFQSSVMQSDEVWLVEFYAPWCGHCKNLAPEWKKAAAALKGVAKVGAVNMDGPDQQVGAPYGVKGFPTIKVFGANKNSPTDYQQGRDANSIVRAALMEIQSTVQARLGGGASGGGGAGGKSAVVELTDSNFEAKVLKGHEPWLVEFYAPWCGHCKNLAPEWASAASQLEGRFKLGAVDATVHNTLGQTYKVQGFPTIKFFDGKSPVPEDYNGGRTASDIVQFCELKLEANIPPPEATEITTSKVFTDNCAGKPLCFIGFFPALLDCNAKCRNGLIDVMKNMTTKVTLKKFGFVWAAAQAQPALEKAFNIGDYPAFAAINPKRLK